MANNAVEDMLSMALTVIGVNVTGLAGGDPVRHSFSVDQNSMRVGVMGLGAFNKSLDSSGILEVDLIPTSSFNDLFNRLFETGRAFEGGGAFPISWADTSGNYTISASAAMITKKPDTAKGSGSTVNTWMFIATQWTAVVGGRSGVQVFTSLQDLPELASLPGAPVPT